MRLLLVQKFGGTSVSTPEKRKQVVAKISHAKKDGYSPVVVVSAPGRRGEPYATDTLIDLVKQECVDVSSRELDAIMSCGEVVAGVMIVAALKRGGFDAVFLNGQQAGILTTMQHGDAQIREIKPDNIHRHANEGRIIVVAGFQGINQQGDITTLGRGGSDTTASALGAALGSKTVEIYTDVNGVMTADPRLVPTARTLKTICYDDMHQLALHGAKVVHPRAVEVAMRHNLHLKVKCTFSEEKGTNICHDAESCVERMRGRSAAGIAHQPDYALLRINTRSVLDNLSFWQLVGNAKIADRYNFAGDTLTIAGPRLSLEQLGQELKQTGAEVAELVSGCTRLSLVGGDPDSIAETAIRFLSALNSREIQTSSLDVRHSVVSGLIPEQLLSEAACAVHQEFFGDCIEGGN